MATACGPRLATTCEPADLVTGSGDRPNHDDALQPEEPMAGFRATSDGVTARFAKPEAAIIRGLVAQVVELVAADMQAPDPDELAAMVGLSESAGTPDDPALATLLPARYRDYPGASTEFTPVL